MLAKTIILDMQNAAPLMKIFANAGPLEKQYLQPPIKTPPLPIGYHR